MSEREDDLEQQTIDLHFQEAMNNAKKLVGDKIQPKGECYNCEEPLDNPDQLFCDSDCRNDFEFEQRIKERNGKC